MAKVICSNIVPRGQKHNSLSGENNQWLTSEWYYLVDTDTFYEKSSPGDISMDLDIDIMANLIPVISSAIWQK